MPAAVPSMVFSGRKKSYIHVSKLTEKGHISRSTEKERGLKKKKLLTASFAPSKDTILVAHY